MSVRYANRVERVRLPDGSRVEVPGGDPATGLTALALATTRPITGAAVSAVRAGQITPHVSASVVFESTADMPVTGTSTGVQVYQRGTAPLPFTLRTPSVTFGAGRRQNPRWAPLQLDAGQLDAGLELGPAATSASWIAEDGPAVLTGGTPLLPLARNPAADLAGEAWDVTGADAVYSRPVSAVLPQLGLPGALRAHRLASGPLVYGTIVSPWAHARYRLTPGRPFTVAAWLASNAEGSTWRYRLDLQEAAVPGRVLSLYSGAFTVPIGGRRVAATLTVPAGTVGPFTTGVTGGIRFNRARVAVERATAVLAPARPTSVYLDIRGAHAYAGGDRGDVEGLRAVPVYGSTAADDLLLGVLVPPAQRFRFNRVDVHGSDVYGHPTAATVWRVDGQYAHGASTGRVTVRFPTLADNARADDPTDSLVTVYVEEVNTGPGSLDVHVQAVELMHELDVTGRIVDVVVDRTADADPASSTVPIGNYAATTCALTLDNTDRALSPFRASYIDLGHRFEVAAGVVYTNRHDDPYGEGTATAGGMAPWVGVRVPVRADWQGLTPPGARSMVVVGTAPATVQGPGAEGWRVRVGVWALARDNAPSNLRIGWRAGGRVTPFAGHVLPARSGWQYREVVGTIPAGAAMTAITADPGVALACPSIERLDPATGNVIEVVETAPLGQFVSTDWPTDTDSDTVTVNGVDVLGAFGAVPLDDEPVVTGMTAGRLLRRLFRRYLDRGADQVVVADDTPVIPYAIPAADVATMVADVAKAAALTAHTDGAGRPVATRRADVEQAVAVEYREDNALMRASVPFGPSLVRNDVTVIGWQVARTGDGVTLGTVANREPSNLSATAWELRGGEVTVPAGGSVDLVVNYSEHAGALSARVGQAVVYDAAQLGKVAPVNLAAPVSVPPAQYAASWSKVAQPVTVTVKAGATSAVVTVKVAPVAAPFGGVPGTYNPSVVIDHIRLVGVGLVETELRQHLTRASSVAAYGRRPVEVRTRLGATGQQLADVASDVLDNYALRDDTGERWLPDLEVVTLGDPWRELGDRVLAREARSGIGGEYRVVSHQFRAGVAMRSELYLRRVTTGRTYFVLDRSALDGTVALSY